MPTRAERQATDTSKLKSESLKLNSTTQRRNEKTHNVLNYPIKPKSHTLRPNNILQLQSTIGNARVGQIFSSQHYLKTPKEENKTGLPDVLKNGIEGLSGLSMDDVQVHYNSSEPAKIQALAYAQGTHIHVGPGQEKHLPHEAWHVIQQKQGRVPKTAQINSIAINEDYKLEQEADLKGIAAKQGGSSNSLKKQIRPLSNTQNIAQLFGNIRFTNLKTSNAKYRNKAQSIINVLQNTQFIQMFLANKDAIITLERDGITPASISVVGNQVQIQLAPWFFEQQSRGRIIGMLAHEFAVHPLGNANRTRAQEQSENQDIANNQQFQTGLNNHSVGLANAGQTDHIFAAIPNQPRYTTYRETVYQLVSDMQANPGARNTTNAHITDTITTYLSDLAMILATNDHAGKIVIHPFLTAQYYNMARTHWLNYLAYKQNGVALTALTPGTKHAGNVLGEVGSLIGRAALSLFTSSTSDDKNKQGRALGVYDTLTKNQHDVLTEYNLALRPGSFNAFNSLDTARNVLLGQTQQVTVQNLQQLLPTLNGSRLRKINGYINSIQGNRFNGEIPSNLFYIIAQIIQAHLVIIQPNGKIDNYNEGHNGPYYLFYVPKPNPHYRIAS